MRLNELDERIVHALAEDARRSYADIGAVSASPRPRSSAAWTGCAPRAPSRASPCGSTRRRSAGRPRASSRSTAARNTAPEAIKRGLWRLPGGRLRVHRDGRGRRRRAGLRRRHAPLRAGAGAHRRGAVRGADQVRTRALPAAAPLLLLRPAGLRSVRAVRAGSRSPVRTADLRRRPGRDRNHCSDLRKRPRNESPPQRLRRNGSTVDAQRSAPCPAAIPAPYLRYVSPPSPSRPRSAMPPLRTALLQSSGRARFRRRRPAALDEAAAPGRRRGRPAAGHPRTVPHRLRRRATPCPSWPSPPTGPLRARSPSIARTPRRSPSLYGYPERDGEAGLQRRASSSAPTAAPLADYRKTHLFGAFEREVVHPRRPARRPGRAGRRTGRAADLLRRRVPGDRTRARPGRDRTAARARPR